MTHDGDLGRLLRTTGKLLCLRTSPMAAYVWPAWLSWAVLVLVDAYVTANPRAEIARLDLWALQSLATTFAVYAVSVVFLGWWMRRGGRWDGQGSMLNLLAAVDVAELLPGTLDKFGLPG